MLHRHLTLERYEMALEEAGPAAARLRRQAERCAVCSARLAEPSLAPRLAAWTAPDWTDGLVDWEAALRRAIAPSAQRRERGRPGTGRLVAVMGLLAGLLLVTVLPVAASTGPDSALYPVRGAEEDIRWRLTPEPDRAALETDLVSTYLWQARTSAARHDGQGYDAAMQRFFIWAGRLRTDIGKAPPGERSTSRSAVSADRSLVSALATSGPDPAQARRARSMMEDVQKQSEGGDGQHGGSGDDGRQQSQPTPTTQPASGGDGGSRSGGSAPSPTQTPEPGHDDGGHGSSSGSSSGS